MKTAKTLTAIFSLVCMAFHVQAQGSLSPPGAPAPTMKTLQQVEPRTPISSVPTIINQGGSFYLTTNLTVVGGADGITVKADDVTIDLNGFTLRGPGGGSGHGIIQQASGRYLRVHNGRIVNWQGTGSYGILAATGFGNRFEDLVVAECDSGISGGDDCEVTRCHVHDNLAQMEGYGIRAGGRSRVTSCFLAGNNSNGSPNGSAIQVGFGSMVSDCYLMENLYTGIRVSDTCQVARNHCSQNGLVWSKPAIHATGYDNRIEDNSLMNNAIGIKVDGSGTLVAGNRVTGPFTDTYDFAPGNQLDLIISQLPESIDWPASCRLGASLTGVSGVNGITIHSDNVTIDLAGHSLIGGGGSSYGIAMESFEYYTNIVVRNGIIRGWGLRAISLSGENHQAAELILSGNGGGLGLGGHALVRQVTVSGNGGTGIYVGNDSRVIDSVSVGNTTSGDIYGIRAGDNSAVSGCVAENNLSTGSTAYGIRAGDGSTILNCSARGNETQQSLADGYGIYGLGGSTIQGCTAYGNVGRYTGYGIRGGIGSTIRDCVARSNTATRNGYGIHGGDGANIANCSSSENLAQGSFGFGIYGGKGARIVDCSATDNNADVSSVGAGIYGDNGALISGCTVRRNEGYNSAAALAAIYGGLDASVLQCVVDNNEGQGIRVSNGSVVEGNSVSQCGSFSDFGGSAAAIHVINAGNRIEGNHVTTSDRGLDVDAGGNLIVRNTASGNTTQYDIVGGNNVGTIQTSPIGAGAWDNFSF